MIVAFLLGWVVVAILLVWLAGASIRYGKRWQR